MPDIVIWLAVVAVLVAPLTWALNREFDRIERERIAREHLATSAEFRKLRREFELVGQQIGDAMLPALRQLGEHMTEVVFPRLQALAEAMSDAAKGEKRDG